MPYPAVGNRRMPFDIDGTAVGTRIWDSVDGPITSIFPLGVQTWLTGAQQIGLNSELKTHMFGDGTQRNFAFWFFFPEKRTVTNIGLLWTSEDYRGLESMSIQGSADSANGMDGTWETAVYTEPAYNTASDFWRSGIFNVTFTNPVKVLRIGFKSSSSALALAPRFKIHAVHVYGRKYTGETPDDILFCDTDGNEFTILKDFGDRPEGTTDYFSFKLKNASLDKLASTINVQIIHSDFSISLSESGPWSSSLDISSIAANSLSATIYVKNELAPPLLTLGPKATKIIATVGSWVG